VVDRHADLRVHPGMAVQAASDHEADAHARRQRGHRGEHRPALEDRLRRVGAEGEEVVEAPQAVEASVVGDPPDRAMRRDRMDLRRELQADAERMRHRPEPSDDGASARRIVLASWKQRASSAR
jgi:hypothetical protein